MSKYGWERGEIKLSTKEFTPFRQSMIQFHNERQTRLFDRAKFTYGQLVAAGKGKRNFDFHAYFESIVRHENSYHEIFDAIFPTVQIEGIGWTRSRRPKNPQKK